jgi:phage portal protein BeeE
MRIGGAKNMNRTMVSQSPIGGTVNLAASSTDMQMIDNYNLVLQRLCSLVKLPSILVNDNEQSTYNNVVEAKKQAYNEVYIPTAEKFIKGYSRTWLKQWRERTGIDYVMYVDTSKIKALSVSPEERRREARADVQAGILTRNEARQELGFDTLSDSEMDIPTVQSNLIPIQNIDNGAV